MTENDWTPSLPIPKIPTNKPFPLPSIPSIHLSIQALGLGRWKPGRWNMGLAEAALRCAVLHLNNQRLWQG
jgi:hypothetical protein